MHILQGGSDDVSDAVVVSHLGLFIGLRRKVGVMETLGFVAYRITDNPWCATFGCTPYGRTVWRRVCKRFMFAHRRRPVPALHSGKINAAPFATIWLLRDRGQVAILTYNEFA